MSSSVPTSRRARLFAGSALAGATLLSAFGAHAQTLPAIPTAANIKVVSGGAQPVITAPDANSLDVDLQASRTVINWASFHVSGADKVTFHFGATSDIVLNKSPTQVKVDAGGQVVGLVGAQRGGAIWFYSPQGVVISPGAVMTAGNFLFARGDAMVDMDFLDATSPLEFLRGVSDSLLQTDAISSATSASINAAGDLVLSASSGDVIATTALAAGKATVTTDHGAIRIAEVTAGDEAAVTATGGDIALDILNGGAGATATGSGEVSVIHASSGGGDITVTAGAGASLGDGTADRDVTVSGVSASLGAATAGRDVLVTSTTGDATVTGLVSADDDVEVTATTGSVVAADGSLTSTGDDAKGGDAHVLVRSTGGAVIVGSATTAGTGGGAAGDVTVEAATSAELTSGASTQDITITGTSASLGSGDAARDVLVTSTTGAAAVTGAVTAGDDVEVTATTGSVMAGGASLTSTGDQAAGGDAHVLVRSTGGAATVGSAETRGSGGGAAGDVSVEAATTASLTSGSSTQDVTVAGTSATLGSGAASRDVFITSTTGAAGITGTVTAGDDIEVTATTGAVMAAGGDLTAKGDHANGDAHVLARSTGGAVSVGSAATQGTNGARGDIVIEGATTAALGSGHSSNDITVAGPAASLGSGQAARDVLVTATTGSASVTGSVSAGDDIEVTATSGSVTASGGSLTSTGMGATDDAHVLARSTGGAVSVGSATTQGAGPALGDVTIDAATTASLGSGASSRDLFVLGPAASLGSATVARDVVVTATTGPASVTGSVSAGDDIEVTSASGSVTAAGGALTSTGVGASDDAHVLARAGNGAVTVGSASTQGAGPALGDVIVEAATTASLGSGGSSRDIAVSGSSASLGSASAARDVFVAATTGSAGVTGSVSAGDDIEVTSASGPVTAVGGSLTATGSGAADDAHILVMSAAGAVTLGSATTQGTNATAGDITIGGATTATLTGTARASRDVVLQAGGAVLASGSQIVASRDVAVHSDTAGVALGSARAGDDLALRALAGSVTASGDLRAGTTAGAADPAGAADTLAAATLAGHDLDVRAQTVALTGDVAAGRVPDPGETLDAAQQASDVLVAATNPDASGVAALRVATGSGKQVTAHQDVVLTGESAAGGSIQAGDVFAGRDVAVRSTAADVSLGSALAGDDVVLRAPAGLVQVTGDVAAGRDAAGIDPADAPGAGDDLNTALPFIDFDGNPGTVFKAVGFDVSIAAQAVHVTGATIAGRQPSTADPDSAGPVDTSTSDVRIETRVSATPVIGLAPDIQLGAVTATRDLQIDSAKAVVAGDLKAGRDVAVLGRGGVTPGDTADDHSGAGVTVASARAGDDALIFSVYGRAHVLGGVSSGAPFPRLAPVNDPNLDGATEAADQLAIYLRYFDLDDASTPYVLQGSAIHISGQGVTVGGALVAQGTGSDVRLRSSLDIDVTGPATAARFASFRTDLVGGGALTVGAVTAGQDVMLDGAGVRATGTLRSTNSDVAVRSRSGGDITLAGVTAGDDVVLRATGQVAVSGAVTTGAGPDTLGLGDALRISDGTITLEGQAYDLAGHDVDIAGASVTTTGTLTGGGGGGSDVRVQSAGAISLGAAMADRDVLVDGGSTVSTGLLSAGRDVGVRSTADGATLTVGGATAGDDVVIRAKGAIDVTGALSSANGGSDSGAANQAGDLMFGVARSSLGADFDLVGRMIDVRSSAGAIVVTAAASAATDARFQTQAGTGGSVKVAAVTAGRDVLLDGLGAQATDTLTSTTGDVAVRARDGGAIALAGASAGDDVVLRTSGSVTLGGAIVSGGGMDGAGAGDTLRTLEGTIALEGFSYDLNGGDIDILAGAVSGTGGFTASGAASDVRIRGLGAIAFADATAGRDVLVDGGAAVTTGVLYAGRDVGVRSTGDGALVTVGGATAGDDVVVRAKGAIRLTGAVSTSAGGADSADADQAGDLMFGAAKTALAGDFDLVGRNVDLRSSAGAVEVTASVTAATDARFQTGATGGSVKVASVTAGRDVLLDGAAAAGADGAVSTGSLMAVDGDVAIRARDGGSIRVVAVSAGDDVALRSTGAIVSAGTVATTGAASTRGVADRLIDGAEGGRLSVGGLTFDLNGSDIDVVGGTVNILRTNARGSSRIKAGAVSMNGGASVGVDILVDSATSLTVGDLSASGDIALRSRAGSLTVGRLVAGDDIVLRAALGITAGALKAGGGGERMGVGDQLFVDDPSRLGDVFNLMGGAVDLKTAGGGVRVAGAESTGDVRLQAQTGEVTISGVVTAGRDIFADGGSVNATGALNARGDVALQGRTGAVRIASASAGDDLVIRASGDVAATGELKSGQGADSAGVGDRLLISTSVTTATGVFGVAANGAGGVIDLSGATIRLTGAIVAAGGDAHLRLRSTGATTLGDATLSGDIAIDAGGDVTAGALSAGRDLAVRASDGTLSIASATAGDDIVLRAGRAIAVRGVLDAGRGADVAGVGDVLFDLGRTSLGGDFDLAGHNIDVASTNGSVTAGRLTATGDVRVQARSGDVAASDVNAGRDVLIDGASVNAGALRASRDVAVRARSGSLSLASASAGDDVVLRAQGAIGVAGAVSAGGGADAAGAGDRLFAADGAPVAGQNLVGRHVDAKSAAGAISSEGSVSATDDIRLRAAGAVTVAGRLDAGRDALLQASGDVSVIGEVAAARDVAIDGGAVDAKTLRAGRDVAVQGRNGRVALGSVTAGDDIVLRAAQDITVTDALTARGGADGEGAGDRLFAEDPTALAGDFGLAGANIDARSRGGIAIGGPAAAGQDARFQTVGDGAASLGAVTAGADILADARDVSATGELSAGRDVAVRARDGAVSLASASAGDDIAIRAAKGVSVSGRLASGAAATAQGAADRLISGGEGGAILRLVDPLAKTAAIEGFALDGGDIDIKAGEDVALEGDLNGANIRLQAATRLSLAGATAADTIFARGADFSLGGAWRATTARLEVTAGGLALGEGVAAPSGGLALSSEQLGRIDASTVQIFLGDTSGETRGGDIAVGNLAVDTARIRTSLELYAGGLSDVTITGAFAPLAGGANTTALRIGAPDATGGWTPRSIRVVGNGGGSIGYALTTGGRTFTDVRAFNSVELNARGDILMGYQNFIDRLATTAAASVPGVVKSLLAPQTTTGPRILVVAGALTLRADGKVAQQDTGGLLGSTPTGLYLLGAGSGPQLLLGRTTKGATGLPEFIELNGALTSGGTIMTGDSVSLASGIAFDAGVSPSSYYRLNTCAILQQGSCMPSNGHPTIAIPPEQLTGLTLEDRTAAAGAADPTVASATNEEVWKDPN